MLLGLTNLNICISATVVLPHRTWACRPGSRFCAPIFPGAGDPADRPSPWTALERQGVKVIDSPKKCLDHGLPDAGIRRVECPTIVIPLACPCSHWQAPPPCFSSTEEEKDRKDRRWQ